MCRWLLLASLVIIVGCGKSALPTSLTRSGKMSVLGAPLPVGFKLVQQGPVDPVTGDRGEFYSITASASDIMAYFDRAMLEDGWEKADPDGANSRYFKKGAVTLAVATNPDGGVIVLTGPTLYEPPK